MTADDTDVVHRVAYIFHPSAEGDDGDGHAAAAATPSGRLGKKAGRSGRGGVAATPSKKRRRVSGQDAEPEPELEPEARHGDSGLAAFPTLLQGREPPAAVARRKQLYTDTWADLDGRIQNVLQQSNQATLDAVHAFIEKPVGAKLPAAFVVLGPAATSDMLLFQQLAASLASPDDADSSSSSSSSTPPRLRRMVRLRSAEAPNLRAALKAIVQAVTSANDEEEEEEEDHNGYLAYDLEAVRAVVRGRDDVRIVVSLEDSEAFGGGLLADLLAYLHAWLDRIPFVLVFGIATSVDLFQARLPKTAAVRLAAAQFDVAPSSAVLDRLVRRAVAAADVPLRLGPGLLRALAERQDEQVAGVSVFVNSLKYTYMSYFYANALSVFLDSHDSHDLLDQADYRDALRQLSSFQRHVEGLLGEGRPSPAAAQQVRQLLTDDSALRQAVDDQAICRRRWTTRLLWALHLAAASHVFAEQSFTELYIAMLEHGAGGHPLGSDKAVLEEGSIAATMAHAIRRMSAPELVALLRRLVTAVQTGDPELGLPAADDTDNSSWSQLKTLSGMADEVEELQRQLESRKSSGRNTNTTTTVGGSGAPQLRSKYTAQSKVLRTTVVAQRVQLSRDSAALTDEDQAFTALVDRAVDLVVAALDVGAAADEPSLWLHEVWLCDARSPYRDVFVPRPGLVLERALSRPADYLGEAAPKTLPTAILYQMYREAGPLINVADLWTAFQAVVGDNDEPEDAERRHLVQFYQGLADLKATGFVKATRKKADHVAKVKWL